ncbi:MAG: tryptophan synthase subunit alpha [Armatimonadetes bacterium]|nr:tryptophan synthase subunit alpha [Armatimonadota bacterium]
MSAIDKLFSDLRSQGKKALMPFITAGDPDLSFTADLLRELDLRGASICEVGVPYSDPIADGPVIQASYTRALDKNVKLQGIFNMLRGVTPKLKAPIVTMVSYAIIFRHGLEKYVANAKQAGVAGPIVPDLLVEEADAFS